VEKDWGVSTAHESLRHGLSSKNNTATALGVDPAQIEMLIEACFLERKALPKGNYCTDESIKSLIAIFEGATREYHGSPRKLLSFRALRSGRRAMDVVDVVDAIVEGKLVPRWIDRCRAGLQQFFFDAEEVDSFVRSDELSGECSLIEVRRRIRGTYYRDVKRLLAAGLIQEAGPRRGSRGVYRICLRSVETFNRTYASSATIASRYRITSNHIDDRLRRSGLTPILARDGDGTGSYWPLDMVDTAMHVTKRAKPFAKKERNLGKVRKKR
jgi:hypothetical protein